MNWKDIINDSDKWTGLRVEVDKDSPSKFYLESGANCRFKLYNDKKTVFWGTFGSDYWGVWILNNKTDWDISEMPVIPITSQIVETSKSTDYYKFWSRFFIKQLSGDKCCILRKGLWTLTVGSSCEKRKPNVSEYINDVDNAFDKENPRWVEWDIGRCGSIVALKEEPGEDSGRVKWFRKLVREDSCPPVLVWFLNCIDGYVILDGHSRLKAFQLESVPAKFLVLNQVKETEVKCDPKRQRSVLLAVESRQNHPVKPKMSVEQVNELLISAFDTRPYCSPVTKAKATRDYDEKWTSEVKEFGLKTNLDTENLKDMIDREEY